MMNIYKRKGVQEVKIEAGVEAEVEEIIKVMVVEIGKNTMRNIIGMIDMDIKIEKKEGKEKKEEVEI